MSCYYTRLVYNSGMARFTFIIPNELNDWLSSEAKEKGDSKNHFAWSIIQDYRSGADFTLCAKYRFMIIRLLKNADGIPSDIRDGAYDLLNKAFEEEK